MVQVRVLGVALDAAGQRIVLLKPLLDEAGAGRVLPIWIGDQEATSIAIAIQGEQAQRPLTHDLMKSLLDAVNVAVERVEVTRIEDGTFFAEITLAMPEGQLVLDARPSDAVALAVRTDAPLFVAEGVLDASSIPAAVVESRAEEAAVDEFKKFLDDVDPEDFQG